MKMTFYELLGLVKDGKAPKKIKYESKTYSYDELEIDYKSYSSINDWHLKAI